MFGTFLKMFSGWLKLAFMPNPKLWIKIPKNGDTPVQFHCFLVVEETLSPNRTFSEISLGGTGRGAQAVDGFFTGHPIGQGIRVQGPAQIRGIPQSGSPGGL